jgi:hypothetical protein
MSNNINSEYEQKQMARIIGKLRCSSRVRSLEVIDLFPTKPMDVGTLHLV